MHALLANLPADQNLCPKRQHRKLDWILHVTLILTKTQKSQLTKTLAEKNGLCQSKPQTNQNEDFQKPDITKRQQRQRSRDNFTNSTYQNFCRKKTNQFWKPTKPTANKAEATKQSQSKPPQTETQIKNLEASFSDWTKTTWNFADEKKLVERKSQTWKPADWKPDSNTIWKNATAKKLNLFFQTQRQNETCESKTILVLLLGYPTVCVTRAGAGGGTLSEVEKDKA